jgi:ParB family chromosome partitioning protein
MAGAVQKITLLSSRDIPFNKLVLGQSNLRRMKADGLVDPLKAIGFVSEIIRKLRLFMPTGSAGPAIPGTLMERFPLVGLTEKATA